MKAFFRMRSPREEGRSCNIFYDLASGVMLHFCNILLVTQISPIQCGRYIMQEHGYSKAKITGGHLGDWLLVTFLYTVVRILVSKSLLEN